MVFPVLPGCEEPDRLLEALQAAEIMGALEVIEILLYYRDKLNLPEELVKALEETHVMLQELLRGAIWPNSVATNYIYDLVRKKLQERTGT